MDFTVQKLCKSTHSTVDKGDTIRIFCTVNSSWYNTSYMNTQELKETISSLMQTGKGILAADESNSTAGKRLASVGVENSEENRRLYRELFLSTKGIEQYLSGVILADETVRQNNNEGKPFVTHLRELGIVPGIKVDGSTFDFPGFPGEKLTAGLDGLRERLQEYYKLGARFAKWRAVITIGDGIPTDECIHTNSILLALYARLCQEEGIVPILEPEVIYDGDHSIEKAEEVTTKTLSTVFYQAKRYKADLSCLILKTSMVLAGKKYSEESTAEEVGKYTVRTLKNSVPQEVPGIVFLSGGQDPVPATEHLDAITAYEPLPWELAFSYARAIQGPALEIWKGDDANLEKAREEFIERLKMNVSADMSVYSTDLED